MSFVGSTDLAAVHTEQGPILYYQRDGNIYEAKPVGSEWTSNPVLENNHLESWGGPITAFHVQNDGSNDGQSTIHVIFKDEKNALREVVRTSNSPKWTELDFPADIKSAVVSTSKLASGVCHDDSSSQSHQWLFFVSPNPDTAVGGVVVSEIRKGSESSFEWVFTKSLPQHRGTALESTKMSAHLTDQTTRLYFQNHQEQIVEYHWTNTEWSGENVVRDKDQVTNNSALAVSAVSTQNTPHLFFVQNKGKESPKNLIMHVSNGKETEIATWVGGSTLGSTTVGSITHLFYVGADKPTNIQLKKFDGGSWGKAEIVI